MREADKFKLLAGSLRKQADRPEQACRRSEVLSLAAYFDKLALEAQAEQEREVQTLPQCATFYPTYH